jgi:hypothetical protein
MPDTDREFAALISLATRTLNTHINDADLCAMCARAWPCERAVLAEHNLEALSCCQSWTNPVSTPTEAAGPTLRSVATPMRGGGGR